MSDRQTEILFNVHGLNLTLTPGVDNVHGSVTIKPGTDSAVHVKRDPGTGKITVSIDKKK